MKNFTLMFLLSLITIIVFFINVTAFFPVSGLHISKEILDTSQPLSVTINEELLSNLTSAYEQ